jgi:hypothetical protein
MADPIGYGKPPKQHQFRKGESGNPSGRKKSVPTIKTDLAEELRALITVREDGQQIKVSKQRAVVKSVVAAAINGNLKAATLICQLASKLLEDTEDMQKPLAQADAELLRQFIDEATQRRQERQIDNP